MEQVTAQGWKRYKSLFDPDLGSQGSKRRGSMIFLLAVLLLLTVTGLLTTWLPQPALCTAYTACSTIWAQLS